MTKVEVVYGAIEKQIPIKKKLRSSFIFQYTRLALLTGSFSLIGKVVLDGLIN
jgi:hypothetical protein